MLLQIVQGLFLAFPTISPHTLFSSMAFHKESSDPTSPLPSPSTCPIVLALAVLHTRPSSRGPNSRPSTFCPSSGKYVRPSSSTPRQCSSHLATLPRETASSPSSSPLLISSKESSTSSLCPSSSRAPCEDAPQVFFRSLVRLPHYFSYIFCIPLGVGFSHYCRRKRFR